MPIFLGAPKFEHLSSIADSILNIFSRWRGHTLSLASRRCLINSIISSSLVHTMMVYRWPKTILQRLEVAIRSYLWTGDTSKKGFSDVEWKRCCASLSEGSFGIRSLRLANASFCCKLAWDIPTSTNKQVLFIRNRYFDESGNAINRRKVSSIRAGIHDHIGRLNDKTRWLIGQSSRVNFWSNNWLGYRICDKINIPDNVLSQLNCRIEDYLFDGV